MKKPLIAAAVIAAMMSTALTCSAAEIKINGRAIETDTEPVIVSDRTLVPMRAIFEALGAEVEWLGESQVIAATRGSRIILMKIGSNRLIMKDIETDKADITELDAAPMIMNGRTMVPVRAAAEALDASVDWDGETQTVIIETES